MFQALFQTVDYTQIKQNPTPNILFSIRNWALDK